MNLSIGFDELKGFWIAFLISAVSSVPIMKALVAFKSRQTVSQHAPEGHQLKQGTPTMGGLIIIAGFLGAMPFVGGGANVVPLVSLFVLFALIGFVDDYVIPRMMPGKRGLGWKQKIIMQFVAAVIPLLLAKVTSPLTIGYAVFVILFFANAFNFSDGLDGLASTILVGMIVGAIGLCSAPGFGFQIAIWPFLVLLGALIPFLYWNAPKAKVFMGDVGSLPIGALLGGIWFLMPNSTGTHTGSMTTYAAFALWSMMMVAELVPVPLQIASVKIRKKKIFPYTPIHHAFEKAGWPETRVVFVFAICQLLFSILAITVASMPASPGEVIPMSR